MHTPLDDDCATMLLSAFPKLRGSEELETRMMVINCVVDMGFIHALSEESSMRVFALHSNDYLGTDYSIPDEFLALLYWGSNSFKNLKQLVLVDPWFAQTIPVDRFSIWELETLLLANCTCTGIEQFSALLAS